MHRFIVAAIMLLGSWSTFASTVVGVTPQGEVAQVRQVTVRFSQAVVPFGDPRLPDPFALQCVGAVPAGAGRWINDRAWVYDFREPLPPGTQCALTARPEWKPTDGALTGTTRFAFSTGGPAVVSMLPAREQRFDRGGPAFPDHAEWSRGRGVAGRSRVVRSRRAR